MFIGESIDGGSKYVVVNLKSKKIIGDFFTLKPFQLSEDGKFLVGWQQSETKHEKELVCPQFKDKPGFDNYVVTHKVMFNLITGKTTITEELACSFIQRELFNLSKENSKLI